MEMVPGHVQLMIEQRIVREFGDGVLRGDQYLADQIRAFPGSRSSRWGTSEEVLRVVRLIGDVYVFFDRHPNNHPLVMECLKRLGWPPILGARVTTEELEPLLACDDIDMYVTTIEGELLAAPFHEDEVLNGVRTIWMPVRGDSRPDAG